MALTKYNPTTGNDEHVSSTNPVDTSQATLLAGEDQTNDIIRVEQGQFGYEVVGSSSTAEPLGVSGAAGDYLHSIIQGVSSNSITLIDGSTSLIVFPATAVCVVWEINAVCTTAWKITTGASTYCMCVGRFT